MRTRAAPGCSTLFISRVSVCASDGCDVARITLTSRRQDGNVEEVELPACTPGLYSALAPALASSAEEVAVLRSVGCPLPSCRQTFAVPKRQLELEEHLQAHLADLHASLSGTSNAVHVANQVRYVCVLGTSNGVVTRVRARARADYAPRSTKA